VDNTGQTPLTHRDDDSFGDKLHHRTKKLQRVFPATRFFSNLGCKAIFASKILVRCGEGKVKQNLDDKALLENIKRNPDEQEFSSDDLNATGALVRSNVLAQLGLSEKPLWEASTEQLLTTLQSSDISRRVAAAHALSGRPYSALHSVYWEMILELTKMALSDVTWQGQVAALRALGKLGGPGKSELLDVILLICLQQPHENVRAAAAQTIGEIYSSKEVQSNREVCFALRSALRQATLNNYWTVRAAALRAIGMLHLSEYINRVVVELDDEDDSVRIEAIRAFACLKEEQAIPRLEVIARNDHEVLVRRAAIEALQQVERPEATWKVLAGQNSISETMFPEYLLPDLPSSAETSVLNEERRLEQDIDEKVIHLQQKAVIYRPLQDSQQTRRMLFKHRVEYRKRDGNFSPVIGKTEFSLKRPSLSKKQTLHVGFIICMSIVLIICGYKFIPAEAYNSQPQILLGLNNPQHIVVQPNQRFSGKLRIARNVSPNQFICSSDSNCMGSETTLYGKHVCVLREDDYVCTIPFQAPSKLGTYYSTWQVKNNRGFIGTINFSVQVKTP